ncbi:MAG: glycosyltransferase family 2 protein [Sandaracinaceae bacterium]
MQRSSDHVTLVSAVIPVFNEERTLLELVRRVRESEARPQTGLRWQLEIILVDDGSTDRSRELLATLADSPRTRVILQPENRGKGAALRAGFEAATGEIVLVQDADLEYDPGEYPKLLAPILEGRADVVYGSRFSGAGPHRVLYYWHSVGNKVLTSASNMLSNLNLTDMETCYKAFRREVLEGVEIEEDRFGFEPEITAKVARRPGVRIYEVGISYAGRTYDEGKKIGWRDGVRALYCIAKYNLRARQ